MSSRRRRARERARAAAAAPPAPPLRWSRTTVALGAAVVIGAFALYLATAARDIVFGDTPELTAVALTFGIAHPPGYPLFTILGGLFAHLPVDPPPFRIALLSVVSHAATVGVVYAFTYHLTRKTAGAVVAAVALATEPLFWSWSLVAEVFPLNDLLSATMLFLVALWHDRPDRSRFLIAGAFVGGLGMSDHQTIALLSPAVFYVMWRRRDVLLAEPRIVLRAGGAFLLGLVPYVELWVASAGHPEWTWGDVRGPGDLLFYFFRLRYGTGSLLNAPQFIGGSAFARMAEVFTTLDPLQWIVLAVGAVQAWRVRRWALIYLGTGFVIAGPLFAAYSNLSFTPEFLVSVLERFFLLPHTVIAPLAGFAVLAAIELAAGFNAPRRSAELAAAAIGVVAALALVPLNYRLIDRANDHAARAYISDLLATLRPGTVLLGAGDAVLFPSLYLHRLEGVRPDVTIVALPLIAEDWYLRELQRATPAVVVTDPRYGPRGAPFRRFVDANRARPLGLVGDLPDDSLRGAYWLYSRGITFELRPIDKLVTLDDFAKDNEPLLASYHPTPYAELVGPFRRWERIPLVDYSLAHYRVGAEYENAAKSNPAAATDLYNTARKWYERALAIKPDLQEALDALKRLPR